MFQNVELYLYIACKPNSDSTYVLQFRSFCRRWRSYIHLFDKCTQNWFAVASILESTLLALKSTYSNLSEAFLRSDNAGCYHNAFLILSLPSIGERARIRVLRYDFSDPQAGKDVCDHRIATLKSLCGDL